MKALKTSLIEAARGKLAGLQQTYLQSLKTIEESKGNETKSSAGDKFETGRAMLQAEEDKIRGHLLICQQQIQKLNQIKERIDGPFIQFGHLVKTNHNLVFISVPLGKLVVDQQMAFLISPSAPLAATMIGKKPGEKVLFNGREILVIDIE